MNPSKTALFVKTGVVVMTLAVLYAAAQSMSWLPDWTNPFGERTKDRSGPVVLQSVRDLSRYDAATGQFQVVVDLEKDARFLPSSLRGERTLFIGVGDVDAYVDFSQLTEGAVKVNADRTEATITLPPAQLDKTSLNTDESRVFATQRGIFDRFGDFFSGNPGDQQKLYQLAAEKIQDAAGTGMLQKRAELNTKTMLENLLKALGFEKVTVHLSSVAQ
ncbi:DUF4230 domain-containing protein [Actinocorallia populi]|uniref:DUF4230 domain-containing protein n=1 Tax=Actinocorallia populi TaxID=2079200 RepID=UPI0018E4F904|nr:DUF4230 domain-containing protein [Actinocorallia populi]